MMTEILALIIGVLWLVVGVRVLKDANSVNKILEHFDDNEAFSFFAGASVLVAGLALVQFHNIWSGWPEILITITIWAMIIKGVMFIVFPKTLIGMSVKFVSSTNVVRAIGIVVMALGAAVLFL